MSIALWCILIAAILPALTVFPGKLSKEFDNANPRDPDYWKSGFRARAQAASANGFEAFPFFAVAVLVGLWQGGDPVWVDKLAVLFILLRLIFIGCYYANRSTPRSVAWAAAFFTILAIFTAPMWSV